MHGNSNIKYESWSTSVSYLGVVVWISGYVWPPWLWRSCYGCLTISLSCPSDRNLVVQLICP